MLFNHGNITGATPQEVTMQTLCFTGNYTKRFARVKEFSNEVAEVVLDEFLKQFCNVWLEEEFTVQSGAEWYQRISGRLDTRAGHYPRTIITTRGVIELSVPRGVKGKYSYTLFKRFKRKTESFEHIVIDALLKGHSSRKASKFFAKLFGRHTLSHQAALQALRRFDYGLEKWKARPIRDNAIILVLDAVCLKGVIPYLKTAKPVLFAYAVYPDGTEEILDFELAQGESANAWTRFCQKLYERGLKNTRLVVRDDCDAIGSAISLCWPKALDQQCVFHILKNFNKKLQGYKNKKKILKKASSLYKAQTEEEFYSRAQRFKNKYKRYRYHSAFKYFLGKLYQSIRYFELPKEYWTIAKTTNRLERFFEELKRRIKVFRRFPNPQSCKRWLYALITELNKDNTRLTNSESQQSS